MRERINRLMRRILIEPLPPNPTVPLPELKIEERSWPGIDVIYDEMRARGSLQLEQVDSIDSKANYCLTSASVLIVAVATLRGSLGDFNPNKTWDWFWYVPQVTTVINVATVGAFALYSIVVFCAWSGYRIRDFDVTPGATTKAKLIIDKWSEKSDEEVKALFTDSRVNYSFGKNEKVIKRKAMWTSTALFFTFIEAVMLASMAVIQAFI